MSMNHPFNESDTAGVAPAAASGKQRLYFPGITLLVTGAVFLLLLLTNLITNVIFIYLHQKGILSIEPGSPLSPFLLQNTILSILIGTLLTFFISHVALRPIRTIIQAIHDVSNGNFGTKLHIEHPREFKRLSQSFNQMTDELSSIELLRSDFINNFSHEFKTPMVSVLGFAKMLKNGDLTEKERAEYLDIIIEESQRLTQLSANILNLSKVESISLLSDASAFNLSEQVRESIVQLETKWQEKRISLNLELEEITFTGNESLLKQVWINLTDNAIKFAPEGSEIRISLREDPYYCAQTGEYTSRAIFSVTDHGPGLSEETLRHMYEKFYQGDTSHASEGNGLGLPLVKKITELHRGTVSAESKDGSTTFTVVLPL